MRYVTFEIKTNEIVCASFGPLESHINNLPEGCSVADCTHFEPTGPLKNYVFVADEDPGDGICKTGRIERKPPDEWDMDAERDYIKFNEHILKFNRLDYSKIAKLTLAINYVDVLRKLPSGEYLVRTDEDDINIHVHKKECSSVPFSFDVGQGATIGGSFPLNHMEVKFEINKDIDCIKESSVEFTEKNGEDFNVFLHRVIYTSLIKLSLRACNKLIEAYRIAFNDPEARAVGMGDILSSMMLITLQDGDQQAYSMGSPYRSEMEFDLKRHGANKTEGECIQKMQYLLSSDAVPFAPAAIALLKMAHFYGQYRESVVWAATIISTQIEKMLMLSLPKNSDEYRKLKNNGKSVSGKDKRVSYFKLGYGITLKEYLERIVSNYQGGEQSKYWNDLPKLVEKVLGDRNLLLHRKKAISPQEADDAFYTCMNFMYAIESHVPYSVIYSRDYHLKMADQII